MQSVTDEFTPCLFTSTYKMKINGDWSTSRMNYVTRLYFELAEVTQEQSQPRQIHNWRAPVPPKFIMDSLTETTTKSLQPKRQRCDMKVKHTVVNWVESCNVEGYMIIMKSVIMNFNACDTGSIQRRWSANPGATIPHKKELKLSGPSCERLFQQFFKPDFLLEIVSNPAQTANFNQRKCSFRSKQEQNIDNRIRIFSVKDHFCCWCGKLRHLDPACMKSSADDAEVTRAWYQTPNGTLIKISDWKSTSPFNFCQKSQNCWHKYPLFAEVCKIKKCYLPKKNEASVPWEWICPASKKADWNSNLPFGKCRNDWFYNLCNWFIGQKKESNWK